MVQKYSFEIVFLGYSIWVLHRVLHGAGLRVLSSPPWEPVNITEFRNCNSPTIQPTEIT